MKEQTLNTPPDTSTSQPPVATDPEIAQPAGPLQTPAPTPSPRLSRRRALLLIIGVVLLVLAFLVAVIHMRKPALKNQNVQDAQSSANVVSQELVIELTPNGPLPTDIKGLKGTNVTWHNTDQKDHVLKSTAQDTNLALPNFSSRVVKPGESLTITLDTPGTYGYTDGSSPAEITIE